MDTVRSKEIDFPVWFKVIFGLFLISLVLFGAWKVSRDVARQNAIVSEANTTTQVLKVQNRINISVNNKFEIVSYSGDESIFGYTPEEIIGKPLSLVIPKDMLDKHTPKIKNRFTKTTTREFTRVIVCDAKRKDGSTVKIENHLTVFPQENESGVRAVAWFKKL